MDLTPKDAARLLNVPEETIHRWIRNGTLPSYQVKDKCRLNRVELLEWAAAQNMKITPEFFGEGGARPAELLLTGALQRGGVFEAVPCVDKPSALKAVCAVMPLPEKINRDELYSVLVAREALCSTGLGHGVAIPHPRGPLVLGLPEPQVTCAYLHQPVEYGALDGKPVSILFVIVSTTVRVHLLLLSHLMYALQDEVFRRLLDLRAGAEELLARLEDIERRREGRDPASSGS